MSDTRKGLPEQLNGLFNFCSKFQMIVNEPETKIVNFGKESSNNHSFMFNNKPLEIVNEYKYLGVLMNSVKTLKGDIFKQMKPFIADKARKPMFASIKKYSSLGKQHSLQNIRF